MWILFARAPRADAGYWPGRRWLAALDAVAWPAAAFVVVLVAPFDVGILGWTLAAVVVLSGLCRTRLALWHNERYRFTTWHLGAPLAMLVALGLALRLLLP